MKQFFILLFTTSTLLLGCDKSYEKFQPNFTTYSDSTWANTFSNILPVNDLYQNMGLDTFVDSVSALNGGLINFPNYISVTVPANAFVLNGQPVIDGKVAVKILLVTQKGDMVRMNLPSQSNGYLLESGGEIYVDALKNGNPLALLPSRQLVIGYRSATPPSNLMKGFIGTSPTSATGINSCFNWMPAVGTDISVAGTSNGYQVTTNTLHWIGCGYYNDTSNAQTTVALSMPLDYTNANTSTFIVYKNGNGVMQFNPDAINRIWVKNNVPVNKAVIFVTISKRGGDYYLGTSEATTTINQHVVIKPGKQKLQDIINYLGTL